ncbi:hypothetical protein ACRAWD_22055 [Caulobacter segnis]
MAVGRGDKSGARETFQSSLAVVGVLSACVAGLFLALVWWLPVGAIGHSTFSPDTIKTTESLLICSTLVSLNYSIVSGVLRAEGMYAIGVISSETIRLVETTVIIVAALLGAGFVGSAAAALSVRFLTLPLGLTIVAKKFDWVQLGFGHANVATIRRLIAPALAVMVIPLAFAINLQGQTLVVATFFGVGAVAMFTASRTLARVVYQAVGIVNHAIMPEVSRAFGRADISKVRGLLRTNATYAIATAALFAIGLSLFGTAFVKVWTHGRILPPQAFLVILVLASCAQSLWNSSANMLLAVNQHARYAYWFLGLSTLSVGMSAVAAKFQFGLLGVVVAIFVCEIAMIAVVAPKLRAFWRGLDKPASDD